MTAFDLSSVIMAEPVSPSFTTCGVTTGATVAVGFTAAVVGTGVATVVATGVVVGVVHPAINNVEMTTSENNSNIVFFM
jgi:hypothetical protein